MSHLSKEKSIKIVNDFLKVFTVFCSNIPIYHLSFPIIGDEQEEEEPENYVIYKWDCSEESQLEKSTYTITSRKDIFMHNTYKLLYKGRRYEMNIYNSCEACGYNSMAKSEEEEERRLFCYIRELRENGEIKQDLSFEFDIVDMTFLDIFEITYINKQQYYRKCELIEEVTAEFVGRKLRHVD